MRCRSSPSPRATRATCWNGSTRRRSTRSASATRRGSPCAFPVNGDTSGVLLLDRIGAAGARDSFAHDPAPNGTTFCYRLFVDTTGGGVWSIGKTNSGKPFPTAGPLKWAFHSGMFSTTAPTVGGAGIIATNNDNAVHSMRRGPGGGEWPAGWKPRRWAARCRTARRSCRSAWAARTPWCSWARRTATSTPSTRRSVPPRPRPGQRPRRQEPWCRQRRPACSRPSRAPSTTCWSAPAWLAPTTSSRPSSRRRQPGRDLRQRRRRQRHRDHQQHGRRRLRDEPRRTPRAAFGRAAARTHSGACSSGPRGASSAWSGRAPWAASRARRCCVGGACTSAARAGAARSTRSTRRAAIR